MNERKIVCEDLGLALDGLRSEGFRIELIYPADDPHTAVLSRDNCSVRVTTRPDAPPPSTVLPPFDPAFVSTRAGDSRAEGRAGMLYRELIPGRLGGRYIASHITIPQGGPVSDWVHYHRVALQIIAVTKGWVRVVYEDQGEPFLMVPGDLVLQPPGIRHRVLESSPGLEVVEITAPAVHETFADHQLVLPNGVGDPKRCFSGQRFIHMTAADKEWTGLGEATGGLAGARIWNAGPGDAADMAPHDGELVFGFVLSGAGHLQFGDGLELGPADSFVIPPAKPWRVRAGPHGLCLLHVNTARMG